MDTPDFGSTYITSSEIVARLGIARSTLKRAIDGGRFPRPCESIANGVTLWVRVEVTADLDRWEAELAHSRGVSL